MKDWERYAAQGLVKAQKPDPAQIERQIKRAEVELTGKILGRDFELLVGRFERMRRSRNVFFYDSLDANDEARARTALDTAVKLSKAIKASIRKDDPQGDLPV